MTNRIETEFVASLGSGTEHTFNSFQKGFQKIAIELQKTAKELLNLQKTEAAEAVGHVSMAINKFAVSLVGLTKQSKGAFDAMKALETANRSFEKTSTLAQQAWAHFRKDIDAGRTTLGAAKARAMEYDKAINNLMIDIKLLGGSERDLNKNISFADIAIKQQAGDLKLVGGQFKNMTADSYSYLVSNKNIVKSLKELHDNTSLYTKTLRESAKVSYGESQVKAIRELGRQVGFADAKFKVFIPVLNTLDTSLTKLGINQKNLTGENAKWIASVDRAAVVNQVLSNAQAGLLKHISMTSSGLKILSVEGMKPFGDLTIKTAQSLGMLDPNFNKFISNMHTLRVLSGQSTEEIGKLTNAILRETSSFADAFTKSKDYIQAQKNDIALKEKAEKAIGGLTIKYSGLLASTTKYGENARNMINTIKQEPKELDRVTASLINVNSEYKKQEGVVRKSTEAQSTLIIKYRELLTATGKTSDEARRWLQVLSTEPAKLAEVKAELTKLSTEFTKQETLTRNSEKAYTKLAIKYGDLTGLTNKYGVEARSLMDTLKREPAQYDAISNSMKKLESDYKTHINQMQKQKEAYDIQTIKFRDLLKSTDAYGETARRVIQTLKNEEVSIGKVTAMLNQLKNDQNATAKSGDAFKTVIDNIAKSFRTYASYMISSNVLQSFVQGLSHATKVVMDHDQALYDLKSILSATSSEVQVLDDLLLNLTGSSRYSITELADGMKEFGQAGFDAVETIQGMPAIVDLATGTMEGLRTATELTSTAVTVFGLGMDDARMTADIFANAVTKSRSTISKLNTSFNYIGPVAEQAGLSIRDTAAATMLMYNAGLRASTVGTGLTNMLNGLMKPSEAFKAAVEKAGYSLDDFNPRMNSFENILALLPAVVTNSEDAIKMFDVRAGRAIMAFTTLGINQFRKFKSSLDEQGVAAKMAATQMEGMANTWKNVQNQWDILIVKMSDSGFHAILKGIIATLGLFTKGLIWAADTTTGNFVISMTTAAAALVAVASAGKVLWVLLGTKLIPQIAIASKALLGFALTPVGATIFATVAAITLLASAMNSSRKETEALIKKETEYGGALGQVRTKLEEYNRIVKEKGKFSSEAQEAGKNLKYAIDGVGKSSDENVKFVTNYSKVIDETGIVTKDLDTYTKNLASTLDGEITKSLVRSAQAAGDANHKWDTLKNIWEGFKSAMSEDIGDGFGFSESIPVTLDKVGTSAERAAVSYKKLKEEAAAGNAEQQDYLDNVQKLADDVTVSLLKNKDAGSLSNAEISDMARGFVESNRMQIEYQGAIEEGLKRVATAAREAKVEAENAHKTVSGTLKATNEGYAELVKNEKTTFEDKMNYIEKGLVAVREALHTELAEKQKAQVEELAGFKGSKSEREALEKDQKDQVLKTIKEGQFAEKKLLKDRQAAFVDHHKERLKAVQYYYAAEKETLESHLTKMMMLEDKKYQDLQLKAEASISDESLKYEKLTSAYFDYTKRSLSIADSYYTKLADISVKDIETRMEVAKLMPEDEKKTSEKILELNIELFTKQKEVMQSRYDNYKKVLDDMLSYEKDLTTKIKAEVDRRKGIDKTVEEDKLSLSFKTMTDKQKHEAETTRAKELASKARRAMSAKEFDEASDYAKQSYEAYKESAGSIAQGDDIKAYKKKLEEVGTYMDDASRLQKTISKEMQASLEETKLKAEEMSKSVSAGMTSTSAKMAEITEQQKNLSLNPVKVDPNALIDLDRINKYLSEAGTGTREVTIAFKHGGADGKSVPISTKIQEVGKELVTLVGNDNKTRDLLFDFKAGGADGKSVAINDKIQQVSDDIVKIYDDKNNLKRELKFNFTGDVGDGKPADITTKIDEVSKTLDTMDSAKNPASTKDVNFAFKGDAGSGSAPIGTAVDAVNTKVGEISTLVTSMPKDILLNLKLGETSNDVLAKLNDLKTKLDQMAKDISFKLSVTVTGETQLREVWDTWSKLSASRDTIVKTIKYVTEGTVPKEKGLVETIVDKIKGRDNDSTNGGVAGVRAQSGQRIPGYGGGDIIPALLEPGEWVINKEAVKHNENLYGEDFFDELNEKRARFQKGGPVRKRNPEKGKHLGYLDYKKIAPKWFSEEPKTEEEKAQVIEEIKETYPEVQDVKIKEEKVKETKTDDGKAVEGLSAGERKSLSLKYFMDSMGVASLANGWKKYEETGETSDLFTAVNTIANELDKHLTTLGDLSSAGAFISGKTYTSPGSRDGFYMPEGSSTPDNNALNFVLGEATSAYSRKHLQLYGLNEKLISMRKVADLLRDRTQNSVLKLQEGGSVTEAISSSMGSMSNIVSPLISDMFNTDTLDVFSNIRRDVSDDRNISQIPPQRLVFELPAGASGEFQASQTTVNDFVKLLKRSKMRSH